MPSAFTTLLQTIDALRFPAAAAPGLPPREDVRALKTAVEVAVRDPAFVVECVARDVEAVSAPARARLGTVPCFIDRAHGIRFAVGLWTAGQRAAPHEHAGWTISAVLHNALEILTYDRVAACDDGRLIQRNAHPAHAGMVGFIYEPGLHAPWNPTDAPTLSLHLIGPHDGAVAPDGRRFTQPAGLRPRAPDPLDRCLAHRQQQRHLRGQGAALAGIRDPGVGQLLGRMVALGNTATRDLLLALLARIDPARAAALAADHAARRVDRDSVLAVPPGPAILRRVIVDGGRARLVVAGPRDQQLVLLDVAAHAQAALERLTSDEPLVVRDLPGGLSPAAQIALCEALDEWGLLRAAPRACAA
jgi:hypothetical protein